METLQDRYEIYVQCADDGTGHEVCSRHAGKDCPCVGSGPSLKSFDEWLES